MATDHQRIGKRILGHLRKKDTQGPRTKDSTSTAKEAAHQTVVAVEAEAPTQLNLHTAYIMAVKPTTAPKAAPSSFS
jgi:hypothetical protein